MYDWEKEEPTLEADGIKSMYRYFFNNDCENMAEILCMVEFESAERKWVEGIITNQVLRARQLNSLKKYRETK